MNLYREENFWKLLSDFEVLFLGKRESVCVEQTNLPYYPVPLLDKDGGVLLSYTWATSRVFFF